MADILQEADPWRRRPRRADEIGLHRRSGWLTWLLGLVAILVIVLLAVWALRRGRVDTPTLEAPSHGMSDGVRQQTPGVNEPERGTLPPAPTLEEAPPPPPMEDEP